MSFSSWKKQDKQPMTTSYTRQFFSHSPSLPLVYKPAVLGMDLSKWFSAHLSMIEQDLLDNGTILFRGFGVYGLDDFTEFVNVSLKETARYTEGATPRTSLGAGVYTATEFPRTQEIALHNELSYVSSPPKKLVFCCLTSPQEGGQTQIADIRKVAKRIDPAILEEFSARGGWMLRRNYGVGFGPTIEKAFETDDLAKIEQYCQEANIDFIKISEKCIRTEQIRPAMHFHPVTGVPVWFNHVAFWHHSSLCPKIRASMKQVLKIEEFPFSTCFADGSPIPDSTIQNIRQAYIDEQVMFDWQVGDVMLIDNWSVAHGRQPYSGARKVVVAMG